MRDYHYFIGSLVVKAEWEYRISYKTVYIRKIYIRGPKIRLLTMKISKDDIYEPDKILFIIIPNKPFLESHLKSDRILILL
jgi:hypothetical protein